MNIKQVNDYADAKEKVKDIIIRMNGLTEEEFYQKQNHDIDFHNGFRLLVDVFYETMKG